MGVQDRDWYREILRKRQGLPAEGKRGERERRRTRWTKAVAVCAVAVIGSVCLGFDWLAANPETWRFKP